LSKTNQISLFNKTIKENKLDKSKAYVKICRFKDIRHIFEEYHYKKGAMGGGISVCFAMFIDDILVGGSVLGKPRHEKKYKKCIDIRRMACLDESPKNSESWFLSQIIRWCASNTDYNYVLSYSDKTVGHNGTIYKAANFKQIGETTPTKYIEWGDKTYHPRSLSIDRPYSHNLRKAVKQGEAIVKTGLPKIIWIYEISNKLKRKNKQVINIYKPNE
jgi:hypothetical protein